MGMPENTDKVEKIMEAFVKRFVKCNTSSIYSQEDLVNLSSSIIHLNSDIHGKNFVKPTKKVSEKEFLTKASCQDQKLLKTVYKSVKKKPLVSEPDHVNQTELLQQSLTGPSIPHLAAPHRRL